MLQALSLGPGRGWQGLFRHHCRVRAPSRHFRSEPPRRTDRAFVCTDVKYVGPVFGPGLEPALKSGPTYDYSELFLDLPEQNREHLRVTLVC